MCYPYSDTKDTKWRPDTLLVSSGQPLTVSANSSWSMGVGRGYCVC